MCVPSDDKLAIQIELFASLLDSVASHHQGAQFFLKTVDTIEMLSGN